VAAVAAVVVMREAVRVRAVVEVVDFARSWH
jgi:hypothetical protein